MSAVHKHIIRKSGGNGCLVGGFTQLKTHKRVNESSQSADAEESDAPSPGDKNEQIIADFL